MNSQFDFKQIPFVRILIPFIAGIIAISSFPTHAFKLFSGALLIAFILVILRFFPLGKKYYKFFSGLIIYCGLFLCGVILLSLAVEHHDFPERKISISAIVKDKADIKENSMQIDCQVYSYSFKDRTTEIDEKIRMIISKESVMKIPEIGDSICFAAKLQKLKNRGNPKEFDYVKYMHNEKIYYSGFVLYSNVQFGKNSGKFKLKSLAYKLQKSIIKSFINYSIEDDELAIISALTAGNRKLLDDELTSKYAVAGVMHVLAVSGLHVGILFIFLSVILWRRNQTKFFIFLRLLVILCAIWFFAFITGLSSSVVRASLMFTLFLFGKSFNRQINSYNILAASALIVLIINPLELFKLGFQFSYIAVLGILYLQPKLFAFLDFKYSAIDRIWQLMSVGIAAQIAIFPLNLYYFHQFPVYFWLANIIVIPLVWLIMVFSILFFISLAINPFAQLVSFVLNALLKILNLFIDGINTLPFVAIQDIRFETTQLFMAYLLIISLLISTIRYRRIYTIYIFGAGVILILLSGLAGYKKYDAKQELLIYNYGKNTVISLINGHNHLMIMDTEQVEDSGIIMKWNSDFQISRQLINTTKKINLKDIPIAYVIASKNIKIERTTSGVNIRYLNKKIKILEIGNLISKYKTSNITDKIDYLVLGRNSGYPGQINFLNTLPGKIIISNRISYGKTNAWKAFALKNKIELHNVKDKGAFVVSLN